MGLSIHYSGVIRDTSEINNLVNEVSDICKTLDWKYNIIKDSGDPIEGILFSPENSEAIHMLFMPDGKLCSLFSFILKEKYPDKPFEPIYTISTKTQYAGMDAHIAIIDLLRYLSEKYFSSFELMDEGNYWETRDRSVLKGQFERYDAAVNMFAEALDNMEKVPGESPGSLAERLEKILKDKFKDGGLDIQQVSL